MYLGLDQASRKIGYALGNCGMTSPIAGRHPLPAIDLADGGVDYGRLMEETVDCVTGMIVSWNVTEVGYETPFFGDRTSKVTIRKLLCVADTIEYVCRKRRVGCREIDAGAWRDRFIGMRQSPRSIPKHKRRPFLKQKAMDACHARGWKVKNDDEAEACGILDYLIASDFPDFGTGALPLFNAGAAAA